MGNVFPFRRLRWGPPWRPWREEARTQLDWKNSARRSSGAPGRTIRRFLFRYSGFLVLAALIGGVLLYQSGYWTTIICSGLRDTDRYTVICDGNRVIRMPVPPNASAIDGDSLR